MAVSVTTLNTNPLDTVQRGLAETYGTHRHGNTDHGAVDWFLPGNNERLETIDAVVNADLQGASPESVADFVLAHIGG